jgi:hypothetical protein
MLRPRKLSATLKSMPYRLDGLGGSITVDGDRVTVDDVTGRHGDAKVVVAGTGVLGARHVWDVRIGGERLPIDAELRAALPTTLAGLTEALKLDGTLSFNLTKFVYRSAEQQPAPAEVPPGPVAPENAAEADAEIDIAGSFVFDNAKMDVGVPLTEVAGALRLDATVRKGALETLDGGIDFASMKMAGRPAKDFRAELLKPAGKTQLHVNKMRGDVADGVLSGQMTLVYPEDGPSRYALELVVRNADVRQLAWEEDAEVKRR